MSLALRPLIIRADATGDAEVGTGHVMRCLALAEAWSDMGGAVEFVCSSCIDWVCNKIEFLVHTVHSRRGSMDDAAELVQIAGRRGAEWVVVDGYFFDDEYQRAVKRSGHRLLFLDDFRHCKRYYADIVLNQDTNDSTIYNGIDPAGIKWLMGTRYLLLRKEFQPLCAAARRHPHVATDVLVAMGGNDPLGITGKIESAICAIPGISVFAPDGKTSMASLMGRAHMGVVCGGMTAMEALAVGLPSIVMPLSSNQVKIVEMLESKQVILRLDSDAGCEKIAYVVDALRRCWERRWIMDRNGRKLVDGLGAKRVIGEMIGVD